MKFRSIIDKSDVVLKPYKIGLCTLFLLVSGLSHGQNKDISAGLELDVLPYIFEGYMGAGWIGFDRFRIRGLFAKVNMPEFMVDDDFTDKQIKSTAIILDYFFNEFQSGFWIGAGGVYWNEQIQSKENLERANYKSYLLNGSFGYVWNLSKRIYLSPWTGLSLRIGGDKNINVGGSYYKPPFFNPEFSLKVGFRIL